ncbi:hypothetical protein [Hydrogenophaga sp.]|uniref:hypothetical protein n=1 Tax=Hydrogenophaga sp. TaxID=1904254 RepID=UPI00273563C7|nr:hypothetical protein [Hydrogenophaga sp.]MDP3106962.1 hypothetical protein [Hydrogenophaga sp.]
MGKNQVINATRLKYEEAKKLSSELRGSFEQLVKSGTIKGLEIADLPEQSRGQVCGFDVFFVDQHFRMVVTGSTSTDRSLRFECWRVPLAYGRDPVNVFVLPLMSNGSVQPEEGGDNLWFDEPMGVHALFCEILSRNVGPYLEVP